MKSATRKLNFYVKRKKIIKFLYYENNRQTTKLNTGNKFIFISFVIEKDSIIPRIIYSKQNLRFFFIHFLSKVVEKLGNFVFELFN